MNFWKEVCISASLTLVLGWVATRYLPNVDDVPQEERDRLHQKYKKWHWSSELLSIILLPIFLILLTLGSQFLYWTRFDPDYYYQVGSGIFVFFGFSFPIAIILPAFLIAAVYKWKLTKEQYSEFEYYSIHCHTTVRGDVIMKIMIWICLPFPILFLLLSLDWNTRFNEDHMTHNSFLGIGSKEYAYSDIIKIEHFHPIRFGKEVEYDIYQIEFKDGSTYQIDNTFIDMVYDDFETEIINLVSQQSGIPITTNPPESE